MTFWQAEFVVREVQRVWLELWGLLNYMEIYKLCMDGHATATAPGSEAAQTIGVFTNSFRVAQDFFTAGLPCWLIRPSSHLTNQKIISVVDPISPLGAVSLESHRFGYPVIFTGSAASLEKYSNIYRYARNFLCSPDPFCVTLASHGPPSLTSSLSIPSSSTLPADQPLAGSSSQSQPLRSGPSSKSIRSGPSQQRKKKGKASDGHKSSKAVV